MKRERHQLPYSSLKQKNSEEKAQSSFGNLAELKRAVVGLGLAAKRLRSLGNGKTCVPPH